jgi:ABC-type metal ion transport system, periplasmic component/surface adhesin
MRLPAVLLAVPVAALALSGCAPTAASDDGVLRVVASTSVYGDVAEAIAGDHAEVRSIVTSTAQDPHSYEVTARDRLELERADLVVYNGGGYDPFVETVLAAMAAAPVSVSAIEVAGLGDDHDHDHDDEGHHHLEGANEHVWYDLHVVADVAERIADELATLDPVHADDFAANAGEFLAGLESVEAELAALAERASGLGVVMTEPVPGYLLGEAGFRDLTPAGFAEAVEEGTDVSPALLAATLAVVADAALVTDNPQTGGPETADVREAAERAGIPVVDMLELLPEGSTYLEWMRDNIAALAAALP